MTEEKQTPPVELHVWCGECDGFETQDGTTIDELERMVVDQGGTLARYNTRWKAMVGSDRCPKCNSNKLRIGTRRFRDQERKR